MSVANSLIRPTYPPQPTQAGFTIQVQQFPPQINSSLVELCRQRLPKGVWLMTASIVLTGTFNRINFNLQGVEFLFNTHNTSPYSFVMTTPIEVLESNEVILEGTTSSTAMTIGGGTFIQFTRLS